MASFSIDQALDKIRDGYVCWYVTDGSYNIDEQDDAEMNPKDSQDKLETLLSEAEGYTLTVRLSKICKAEKSKAGAKIKEDVLMKVRLPNTGGSTNRNNINGTAVNASRIDKELELVRQVEDLKRQLDIMKIENNFNTQLKEIKGKKDYFQQVLENPAAVKGIFGMLGIPYDGGTTVGITGLNDPPVDTDNVQWNHDMAEAIDRLCKKLHPNVVLNTITKLSNLEEKKLNQLISFM